MPIAAPSLSDHIAGTIAQEIAQAGLAPGSRLQGERELAARLGVSRQTVRRALDHLKARGIVAADPARGWFVGARTMVERGVLRGFSEAAAEAGRQAASRLIEARARPATIEEAAVCGLPRGARMLMVRRLRLLDGQPIGVETSRVPADLCPGLLDEDLEAGSIYAALRRAGAGPVVADYALTAAAAGPDEAALCGVAPGSPLLVAEAIVRDGRGRVVELAHARFLADRYQFQARLGRG